MNSAPGYSGEGRILRGTGDSGRLSGSTLSVIFGWSSPETSGKAGYSGEAPELDCFEGKNAQNELQSSPNQKGTCLS